MCSPLGCGHVISMGVDQKMKNQVVLSRCPSLSIAVLLCLTGSLHMLKICQFYNTFLFIDTLCSPAMKATRVVAYTIRLVMIDRASSEGDQGQLWSRRVVLMCGEVDFEETRGGQSDFPIRPQ